MRMGSTCFNTGHQRQVLACVRLLQHSTVGRINPATGAAIPDEVIE
jgi:hypothetical protein